MTGRVRISYQEWIERACDHRARARHFTGPARWRKDRGESHPIEDFLFQYYPFPISLLEDWHPGYGVAVEWGDLEPHPLFQGRHHVRMGGHVWADPRLLTDKERARMWWLVDLLERTATRAANFACHGMHEWAMVYHGTDVRHEKTLALRLTTDQIDRVVESLPITCSHHDAFRFFAPQARPFNRLQPSLEDRASMEQPACIHANMDLYKWAAKSMPWVGSDLLLECFALAMDLRVLDMRASPYDVLPYGMEPVQIETVDGRRLYEREQKKLAARSLPLRETLISRLRSVLEHHPSDALPAEFLPQCLIEGASGQPQQLEGTR